MPQAKFDFEDVAQEPESLDFNNLVECPHCKKPIPADATMCLYCGQDMCVSKKSGWVIGFTILVIVAFIVFFIIYL